MKIEGYGEFQIWESDGHGKACRGAKKTSGIQVRQYLTGGYLLLFTANYKMNDPIARDKAISKARNYIKEYI